MGHYYTAYIKAYLLKLAFESQHIFVIGDSKVSADLVLLYVLGADDDKNFSFILQLCKHLKLTVRLKTWQYSAGMIVVK